MSVDNVLLTARVFNSENDNHSQGECKLLANYEQNNTTRRQTRY